MMHCRIQWSVGLVALAVTFACKIDNPAFFEDDTDSGSGTTAPTTTRGDTSSSGSADGSTSGDDSTGDSTGGMGNCGNDVVEADEECDGSDLGTLACTDFMFDAGELTCKPDCTYDKSGCIGTGCGDGRVNEDPEQCDGPDLQGALCTDVGFQMGQPHCTGMCELDYGGCFTCGDSMVNGPEECDLDNFNGESCMDKGFDDGVLDCTEQCQIETQNCTICGDLLKEGNEQCDGNDYGPGIVECYDIDQQWGGGELGCDENCIVNFENCCLAIGQPCVDNADCCSQQCDPMDAGCYGG